MTDISYTVLSRKMLKTLFGCYCCYSRISYPCLGHVLLTLFTFLWWCTFFCVELRPCLDFIVVICESPSSRHVVLHLYYFYGAWRDNSLQLEKDSRRLINLPSEFGLLILDLRIFTSFFLCNLLLCLSLQTRLCVFCFVCFCRKLILLNNKWGNSCTFVYQQMSTTEIND